MCDVWPDVWPAVQAFAQVPAAAWQVDPDYTVTGTGDQRFTVLGGPVGVRPEAWRELRLSLGITPAQWREMYADIRMLEAHAVETMRARTA